MKLFTTVLAGALLTGTGLMSLAGCSDDEEAPAAGAGGGGAGGSSGSGGSSGAGTGGGGTAGRGGTSGSGGSGGAAIDCTTPAGVTECKRLGMDSASCPAQVQCACDNCACQLQDCEAVPTCVAIRECAARTGCCPSGRTDCVAGQKPCTDMDQCAAEVAAGNMDPMMGLVLVLAVNTCVSAQMGDGGPHRCALCPFTGDGGTTTDSGSSDSGGGG